MKEVKKAIKMQREAQRRRLLAPAYAKRGYKWGGNLIENFVKPLIHWGSRASFNRPQPNTLKANPNRLAFFFLPPQSNPPHSTNNRKAGGF
jgi:hypothetical protein